MRNLTENETNSNCGWNTDYALNVAYKTLGINKVWFWDDQGVSYPFKLFSQKIDITEIYPEIETAVENNEEPVLVNSSAVQGLEIFDVDSGEFVPMTFDDINVEYNKISFENLDQIIKVTMSVSDDLSELLPHATIKIDNKTWDLDRLNESVEFLLDRDHQISIEWIPNKLVETFRFTINR